MKTVITENDVCSGGVKDYYLREDKTIINISANEDEVNLCRDFMRVFMRPDKKGIGSYRLKHIIEKHFNKYISNGAAIVAALREGHKVGRMQRRYVRSPNAVIHLCVNKDYKAGKS